MFHNGRSYPFEGWFRVVGNLQTDIIIGLEDIRKNLLIDVFREWFVAPDATQSPRYPRHEKEEGSTSWFKVETVED